MGQSHCRLHVQRQDRKLIRRVRRAQYAKQPVAVIKPAIDMRYSENSVGSHSGQRLRSFQVTRAAQILALVKDAMVVGIDEAQFLDNDLVQWSIIWQTRENGSSVRAWTWTT